MNSNTELIKKHAIKHFADYAATKPSVSFNKWLSEEKNLNPNTCAFYSRIINSELRKANMENPSVEDVAEAIGVF